MLKSENILVVRIILVYNSKKQVAEMVESIVYQKSSVCVDCLDADGLPNVSTIELTADHIILLSNKEHESTTSSLITSL